MIIIKRIKPDELDTLLSFSKSTFYESFRHLNDPVHFDAYCAVAFTREKMLSELTNFESEFFFVYDGNEITGYIKLNYGQTQNEFKGDNSLEVERIYVSAKYQGRQIGQQLLNFAIVKAKEKGLTFVWLGVWEHNDKAIRFYQHHGLEICGSHEFMVGGDKQTDLLMKRAISS